MARKITSVLILSALLLSCKKSTEPGEGGLQNPILVEQITNYKCAPCRGAGEVLDSLHALYPDKIFLVRVHVNQPYPGDPIYNPGSDTIVSYYSLNPSSGVPILLIDGDYSEVGFDDAQREDYATRWFNKMVELSQEPEEYQLDIRAYRTSMGIHVELNPDKPLNQSHVPFIAITERHAPLPSGSVKPYSHYAMRYLVKGSLEADVVIDSTWNPDSLFAIGHVHDASKKVIAVRGREPGTAFIAYFLSTGTHYHDTTVQLNGEANFDMHIENFMPEPTIYTLKLDNVPRDWTSVVCIGNACVSGTIASDTLQPGEIKEGDYFHFTIIPTTNDSAVIEAEIYQENIPVLKEILKGEVKVQ